MKKLFLLTGLLTASFVASAQQVVNGTVTDKEGNPIPGAKVEIVGSGEFCITELDGTYSIETTLPAKKVKVQYVGMQSKVKKIEPDMVVKLSSDNWWNAKPDKYRWFLSLQGAFPEAGLFNASLGLMVGRLKNVGWYVGLYGRPRKHASEDRWDEPRRGHNSHVWYTGKEDRSFCALSGGGIVRLGCPIYLYVGALYGERQIAWELLDGSYAYTFDCESGLNFQTGVMLKFNQFIFNAGTMTQGCSPHFDGAISFVGNFGIGYCF